MARFFIMSVKHLCVRNKMDKFMKYLAGAVMLLLVIFNSSGWSADSDGKARIIGGITAPKDSWPAMVALLDRRTVEQIESGFAIDENDHWIPSYQANYQAQFCGASLIASRWVVTAAHCLFDKSGNLRGADTFYALVGTSNLTQGGTRMVVTNIFVHPEYDVESFDFDIALLELSYADAPSAQPASLYSGSPKSGQKVIVTGWGVRFYSDFGTPNNLDDDVFGDRPVRLEEVELSVVDNAQCNTINKGGRVTESMLCAGFIQGGKDSCVGDSGGPLMAWQAGEYRLAGVVSFGYGCAMPGKYGIYTRIEHYQDWITPYTDAVEVDKNDSEAGAFYGLFIFLLAFRLMIYRRK